MKYGLFQEVRKMTYGYGLLLKREQGLLSEFISEKEMMLELPPCGTHFLKTEKRTEYFSRTACLLMKNYFRRKGTESSEKEAEKQVISKGFF
jgi:hypothetical protein